jgi:hypothetical protein
MIDLLTKLFRRSQSELPGDVGRLLASSKDPDAMLAGIERLLTENRVKLERLRRDCFTIEASRAAEVARIERGDLSDRMESLVLDNIAHLESQMDSIEGEMRIYVSNINSFTFAEGKIREIRAMKLRGFSEQQIEGILLDHAEQREEHLAAIASYDLVGESEDPLRLQQEKRRAEIKAKILKQQLQRTVEPPTREAPSTEPPATHSAADDDCQPELE